MGQLLDDFEVHLHEWGLRWFTSDETYFQWQRQTLSADDIAALHAHVEKKRHGTSEDETAFYDLSAAARILPVLYSQRYDYYAAIGPLVADPASRRHDDSGFRLRPWDLPTFYASRNPHARG